jgi:hypothetical protein
MNRPDDRGGKPQQRQPQQPRQGSSGAGQQSQQGGGGSQHGEGNYQATRDYNRGVKEHLRTHDVEREARDAAPRSDEEAREMREAEDLGKRKAEGMRDSNDRMPGGKSGEK